MTFNSLNGITDIPSEVELDIKITNQCQSFEMYHDIEILLYVLLYVNLGI